VKLRDISNTGYFYIIVILMLINIIGTSCTPSEEDMPMTDNSQTISSISPTAAETPTIVRVTNIPTNTPEHTATLSPTVTLTVMPTTTETATSFPSLPSMTPTVIRPAVQVTDSTNHMVVGDKMWHPDNVRMTEELPIETGEFPWSPNGEQLVGLDSEGSFTILTLQTGELTTLENVTSSNTSAMWSPDGQHLLYLANADNGEKPGWQLAVFDLKNQRESLITEPFAAQDYVSVVGWSHDSMKVAYIQWEPSIIDAEANTVLKIIDIETHETQEFSVPPPVSILSGSWSPVHDQIVAYGYDTVQLGRPEGGPPYAYNTVYIIDFETKSIETLIEARGEDAEPSYYSNRSVKLYISNMPWSPDGKSVIYSDQGVICYFTIDSREETCLPELTETIAQTGAVGGEYPSWSPTGDWLGFVLRFDSLFCSPLAAIRSVDAELRYTEVDAGDCSVFWGFWSPKTE
jgi:Tol biopolymer transport system component